ncbi:MAG: ArsR family transcriptional regulator [Micropruina sp.]|uniref:ArsR family transcriptional regulator n=1 Tax=Micropruina sp. TaxID=2737536 RepID=UPI0039E4BD82
MDDRGTVVDTILRQLDALRSGASSPDAPGRSTTPMVDLVLPPAGITLTVNVRRTSMTDRADARRLPEPRPGDHPVLIAPFLSPAVRDELRRSGWSYSDATGNLLIQSSNPLVWIDRLGANRDPSPDPLSGPQRLRSLKGRSASEVIVRLLANGQVASVRELARQTEVGVATVSRVVEFLRDAGLVADVRSGKIVVSDKRRLALRWADDYSFTGTFKAKRYYSMLGDEIVLQRLRSAALPDYAITGVRAANDFIGQKNRVGLLPSTDLWLYVADLEHALTVLDLVPDPRGTILVAQADFLTSPESYRSGASELRSAQPWRVVGDLLSTSGRTAAVGDDLLRELLASGPTGMGV